MTQDPWAHIQGPNQTAAAPEDAQAEAESTEVEHEYAVATGAGVLMTERIRFGSDETEPYTAQTAAEDAQAYRGTVQRREVRRGPWQDAPVEQHTEHDTDPAPVRTLRSPASPGQKRFVANLLRDRVVPDGLRRRVEACRESMTDRDARELIPLLKSCPKSGDYYDHEPYEYGYNPGSQEHDV